MRHDPRIFLSPAARAARNLLTLPVLCAAVLVAQLDTSVANLAIRPIGADFAASLGALQWVIDSYNLVYAALLLTGGLLADLLGRRRVFMAGVAVFAAGSLACAVAPNIATLLLGRAVTGLGAALLLPASLAVVRVAWPDPRERGRALGVWTGCNGVALAIGPTLGGALIHGFGWRGVFLLVVPVAIAAFALAPAAFAESADRRERDFDWSAQAAGALALGALALAAIESHRHIAPAAAALAVAAAALAAFLRIESRRGAMALVPLPLFGVRPFRASVTAAAGMTFGMYGMMFLLPLFWLSRGMLTPVAAGLAMTPSAVAYVVTSPFSGHLAERFGARLMMSGGVAVIGCGLALIAASAPALSGSEVGLALTGLGMGLATGPMMEMAVGAVAAARSGTAASLINVARMAGATIGVAVLGAVFALAGGGPAGLRLAMLMGGAAQIAAAAAAWATTRRDQGSGRF